MPLSIAAFIVSGFCGSESCRAQGRTELVAETQVPTGSGGEFSTFSGVQLNNQSQISFLSDLQNTSGGTADDRGIYLWDAGLYSQIAREGQAAPDGNGTFSFFNDPVLNDSGAAAFFANLAGTSGGSTDSQGIFRGSGGGVIQIARAGQAAPDGNGTFVSFSSPVLNDSGAAAFRAFLSGTSGGGTESAGIFRGSGGTIKQIARGGQAAPDGNGTLLAFATPVLNDSGAAAFLASLTGTSGGTTDDFGIFRGSGGTITQIVRAGQAASDGNGTFSNFFSLALNASGQAAFHASLTGTSGGSTDSQGIFRGSGGAITQIARLGQAAPDGNGSFFSFSSPVLNDSGAAAFRASLGGTSGGSTDDSGIFRGSGGTITQIVRKGQAASDGNGTFSGFLDPVLNNSGAAAFGAVLTGTSGGSTDNSGIFLGDGIDLLQVVRTGQPAIASTIASVALDGGLNEFGQVAYRGTTVDGREFVQLFTPDLHYRSSVSGSWDDPSNWTLGLDPAQVHSVSIDPDVSLTVTGPNRTVSVQSVSVGRGNGIATLNLVGGDLQSAVGVASNGRLIGAGQTGFVRNEGTVTPDNITVNGGMLNLGEINGNGRLNVNGALVNQLFVKGNVRLSATDGITNVSIGQFRVASGESMMVSGFFNPFTNQGTLEVIGGELEIQGPTTNAAGTGFIALRDGTIRFNDGQLNSGMTNDGSIGVTFGTSDIFGDINNTSTGIINIAGGANATFYDDVTQNGTMVVASVGNTSSTAVFFGSFGGTGGFTGGGDVFAFGDLRPGASPASVLMDGNLFLGGGTDTFIELAGLDTGEFDQMIVTGDLNLAGDLFVDLIDGFQLSLNEEFLIADVGGDLFGQFNGLAEGDLVGNFGGFDLFISYTAGDGNDVALFTAVPEPSTTFVLGLLGLGLFLGSRKRSTCWDSIPQNPRATRRHPAMSVTSVLIASSLIVGSFGVTNVSAQTSTWLGGAGNWVDAANWSHGIPGTASTAVIDNGNPVNSDVLYTGVSTIRNLVIDAGDKLRIAGGSRLDFSGGSLLTNNGLIELEGNQFAGIRLDNGDLTIQGSGTIRLTAISGEHNISGSGLPAPVLTNGAGHTIEGIGSVGSSGVNVVNQGIFHNNVDSRSLTIRSAGPFDNRGTVLASNGGIINMFSNDNIGTGLYQATGPGSTIHFFGASVSDSTFNGVNGGLVFKNGSGVIELQNITNLGSFRAQTVRLRGDLNNQGKFEVININTPNIELANDVTLSGGGSIEFTQGGSNITGAFTLTNLDNTFSGLGVFDSEIEFASASILAPGIDTDQTASFDFNSNTSIDGTMMIQLGGTNVNFAAPDIDLVNTETGTTASDMSGLEFDQLNVFNSLIFDNNALLDVQLVDGFLPQVGDFFDVVTADEFGFFGPLDMNLPVINGLTFSSEFLNLPDASTGTNRDVLRLTFGAAAVPEPNTLFLCGLIGLGALACRRRR